MAMSWGWSHGHLRVTKDNETVLVYLPSCDAAHRLGDAICEGPGETEHSYSWPSYPDYPQIKSRQGWRIRRGGCSKPLFLELTIDVAARTVSLEVEIAPAQACQFGHLLRTTHGPLFDEWPTAEVS